ncbi:hypothetical protein ACFX15_013642 [Malus domestica]
MINTSTPPNTSSLWFFHRGGFFRDVSRITLPALERQRYREHYDCEVAATAGAITPITIPETSPYPR